MLDALHMDEWETPGGMLFARLKEISLEIKGCDNDIKKDPQQRAVFKIIH